MMAMKNKKLRKKFICLLFLIFVFLFPALPVNAAERTLSVISDEINAALLSNASMRVEEKITVEFSGQWNGFYRTLRAREDCEIKNVKVYENGRSYSFNPTTEYGPAGTYLIKQENDGILVDWSIDAYNEVRTFVLYYEITNVVKIYNDTAELYWQFIGDENEQSVKNAIVNLALPAEANNYVKGKDIQIWGHGPIDGEVLFDDYAVIWKVSPLPARTYLEGRVVMPTSLFSSAPRSVYTNKYALEEILAEEQNYANEADRQRKLEKVKVFGGPAILFIFLIVLFLLWLKHGRAHKVEFDEEYYRELPATYSPAELNYLINKNRITSPSFISTLLDLARRKYYKIDETTQTKDGLLFDKEITTYTLTRTQPADVEVLRPHEKKFLNLLFDDISPDGHTLTLEDIETYTKKSKTFYNFWNSWTALIESQAKRLNFFEKPGKISTYTVLIGIVLFFLSIFIFSKAVLLAMSIMISALLFMIIPASFKRRSIMAEEDYEKWKAFKRFLLHFSQMKKHEIPSLVIWEHYLVYAAALGIAKEVLKQLKIVYPDLTHNGYRFGHGWFYFTSMNRTDNVLNSFDNFANSIERSLKTAVSKSSSSGSGGGFSSGGGGGGGGGGFGGR